MNYPAITYIPYTHTFLKKAGNLGRKKRKNCQSYESTILQDIQWVFLSPFKLMEGPRPRESLTETTNSLNKVALASHSFMQFLVTQWVSGVFSVPYTSFQIWTYLLVPHSEEQVVGQGTQHQKAGQERWCSYWDSELWEILSACTWEQTPHIYNHHCHSSHYPSAELPYVFQRVSAFVFPQIPSGCWLPLSGVQRKSSNPETIRVRLEMCWTQPMVNKYYYCLTFGILYSSSDWLRKYLCIR